MIKTKLGLIVSSVLVAGLVACGNNEAMNNANDDGLGTVNVTDNVNYNGRTYGPISRNANNNENAFDPFDNNANNVTNNHDFGLIPDRFSTGSDAVDISSTKTNLTSDKYPHTRAIPIQHAKFKYIQANSREDAEKQAQEFIQQNLGQAGQRLNQYAQQSQQYQATEEQNQRITQQNQRTTQQNQRAETEQKTAQGTQPQQGTQQQGTQPQQNHKTNAQGGNKQTQAGQPAQNLSQAVQQVIDLTNAERRNNGLPDLQADTQLSGVAQKKSEDMRKNNYFSHTSPTYGSPFDMMRDFGVSYKTAGENIAQGQQTPEQVVQAWMNSAGHRKNILSKDFTHIGVGYDENGHHWTQMFIGR